MWVDSENAEVDVTFKAYDFGTMLGQYLQRTMAKMLFTAFSGASEEEIDAICKRILAEELINLTAKSYEKTMPMKLIKVESCKSRG